MFQPLKGIKVVDLTQILAGPYATYQMALMGAEIIKIEKPGEGDWTRAGGPLPGLAARRMGLAFLGNNADKKSVSINLKSPEGLELVKKLIAGAGVFVENFKPGVAKKLGLSYDVVRAINPKIVYCSISAYGQDGPLSGRPAYDHVIQGMCGIMRTTGKPGDEPTKVGAPYIDYATGMNAAMAMVAGILEVQRTGVAVQIDVAMLDTALMMMASLMSQHLTAGWVPTQNGNEAWSASPSSGAFSTADGMLMLAANNDSQFHKMCRAMGRDDILQDPRWSSGKARSTNGKSLREVLNQAFLTETAAYWEDLLALADVPAAKVRGLDGVLAEEHFRARSLTSEIQIAGYDRPVHIPTMSFKADGTNNAPQSPPSLLGADTDQVLASIGIKLEQIKTLRESGVI